MSIALGIIISTMFSENYLGIPTDSMDQKIGALLIPFLNLIHYQHISPMFSIVFRGSGEIFFGVFCIFSGKKLREKNHENNYGNYIFDAKLSAIVKTKYFLPFLGFGCTHFILTVFGS